MPVLSTRLMRLRWPLRILTADFGVFKRPAKYSQRATLARSSTAGACRRIFRAPSTTPAISSLPARGCTRTRRTTAPSRLCTSSITLRPRRSSIISTSSRVLQKWLCRRALPSRLLRWPRRNRGTCPWREPEAGVQAGSRRGRAIRGAAENTGALSRHPRERAGCTSGPQTRGAEGWIFVWLTQGDRRSALHFWSLRRRHAPPIRRAISGTRCCRHGRDRVSAPLPNRPRNQWREKGLQREWPCCFASVRPDARLHPRLVDLRVSLPTPAHDSRQNGTDRPRKPRE